MMNSRLSNIAGKGIISVLIFLFAGCGITARKDSVKEEEILTISRLWQMHEDVNFVYFYYEDGSVERGLLLRWDKDKIKIQKRDKGVPETIPSNGVTSIKAVVGNRIWQSLAVGSALGAVYFMLADAGDLGGASLGTALIKMFGAPLIIMASVAYGASSEKTEIYIVPEDFEFNYDEIRRIHRYTE